MPKEMEFSFLIDVYAPMLTEKQREVIELYYYEDLSLAEIAAISEISRQGVRDSIKRAEAIILNLEQNLRFGEYIKNVGKSVEKSLASVRDIESLNNNLFHSHDVNNAIKKIDKTLNKLLP